MADLRIIATGSYYLRPFVVFGLLFGLLLSGGEGIRLFPMPSASDTPGHGSLPHSSDGNDNYQFAVHRFERSNKQAAAKLLKKKGQADASATPGFVALFDSSILARDQSAVIFRENQPMIFSDIISLPTGRAPPAA